MMKFRNLHVATASLLFAIALMSAPQRLVAADASRVLDDASATQRALSRAPRLPRTAFLEGRNLLSVRLSPGGDHVAYLRELGESRSLWLLPTHVGKRGQPRVLLGRTQADQVSWSGDGRWLFLRSAAALDSVSVDGRAGLRVPLGGTQRRQVIKVDPSQAAAVLLRERVHVGGSERWRIVRMDTHGRSTLLHEDPRWFHDVAIDANGRLAAIARFEGDHDAVQRVLPDGSLRELLRLQPMQRVSLLATRSDGSLLVDGNAGGNFRRVMVLGPDGKLQTVHQDPRGEADLDEVVLDPRTQEPVAASYRTTVASTYGMGDAQALVARIVGRFPGRDIALQAGNGPGERWLVAERAATLRDPRWYLYNPRDGNLKQILDGKGLGDSGITAKAPLETELARKISISYAASDGKRVHGFLLLPPGVDPALAPLIAHVHGGPINYFRPGYDSIAQFLANRGYVVFQSNFRGSTGHGRDYTFAARGDFGNGRVQQDIVEGVQWLVAQGIGNPERVGIVGHSFGGYSTLLGLTFQPDLFKVGVAGSAPADFGWSMRWLLDAGDQGALPDRSLLHTLQALSVDPADPASRARLTSQSPQVNAARMHRPLLLIAGGADRTVPIRSVNHYAATLRTLHRPVSLLVEPGGGHSPVNPIPREAYLFAMETMLQRHLGGPDPEAPGQRLRTYLRENLRVPGPEFAALARKEDARN